MVENKKHGKVIHLVPGFDRYIIVLTSDQVEWSLHFLFQILSPKELEIVYKMVWILICLLRFLHRGEWSGVQIIFWFCKWRIIEKICLGLTVMILGYYISCEVNPSYMALMALYGFDDLHSCSTMFMFLNDNSKVE